MDADEEIGLRVFGGVDISPFSGLEVSQLVGADGLAVELGDADVEAEEHALDLVVEAFVDSEAAGGFG
jgi:hypothetical protein